MTRYCNQLLGTLLLALVLAALNSTTVRARSWTLSELDTLSGREWLWIDEKYKEPISEYNTLVDSPDRLPERDRYVKPLYPVDAALAGIEGLVWLKVLIDKKGKVRAARILEDSGLDVGFETAALESAQKSTWKPAVKDGKRVPIWVTYEAAFSLIATKDGKPIHQIDRWHWAVRDLTPTLSQSHEQDARLVEIPPDPFEFTQIDERPIQTKQIPAIYPEFARKKEFEGSVWVTVLVDRVGRVAQAKVAKESGCNCGFEEEALLSAINSKWKPAKQDGVPVDLWVTYEVCFVLRH